MELKLNEEQEKAFYQANIRLTILYILPDICEAMMQDIIDYRKKAGLKGFVFEQKKYWKAFMKDACNLRRAMSTAPESVQASYADSCEIIQRLILAAIDRCNDADTDLMLRFLEYIESFPSKRNIEFKYDL